MLRATPSKLFQLRLLIALFRSQIAKSSRGHTLLHYYRILQLLNKHLNACSSTTLMVGHKVLVLTLTVASSYTIVHFYHAKIFIYLCFCIMFIALVIFQLIAYPSAAALFKITNPIHLIFLPRTPNCAYRRRILRSCAPLKIFVGPFYFFRPFTPMKFFRIEFTYTMKIHFYLRR